MKDYDRYIIRASDLGDTIWNRAQQKARQRDEWAASPDSWDFDGPLTWTAIAEREPRLHWLASYAAAVGRSDRHTYDAWYRDIKPKLEALVGNLADDQPPPLQTSAVYDVVYQHLLRLYEVAA
jgi:hypothetical protein